MIKKQNLLFLSLFSLILVLGVYYITMPDELLKEKTSLKDTPVNSYIEINNTESEYLTALQVEKEDERQSKKANLEEILNSDTSTTEQKNNAYLELKYLDNLQGQEEQLEKKINKNFNQDAFVKINNNEVLAIIIDDVHDIKLANKIMNSIQEEYKEKMTISVKFQS